MMSNLPLFSIVLGAYGKVLSNALTLVRAILIPMIALVLVGVLDEATPPGALSWLLYWLLSLPFVTLIAVACHRVVLLGPDSLDNAWSLYWTPRETSFAVWLIYLGIFLAAATLVFGALSSMSTNLLITVLLTLACVTYLQGRFSMVLPATALGERMRFSNSWYLTAGNGFRIMIALLIPMAIFWGISTALLPILPLSATTILLVPLWLITFLVEIAILSLTYQLLRDSALEP